MRARTDADRRARATAIATTRSGAGVAAVSELWRSFASPEHDLRESATRIVAPTLIVWGRRDPVIPLRVGKRIAKTIPGARLEVLDSGHVPFTTEPKRVSSLLSAFVRQIEGRPPAMHSAA